jgi:hypothetical protein
MRSLKTKVRKAADNGVLSVINWFDFYIYKSYFRVKKFHSYQTCSLKVIIKLIKSRFHSP